ncbi:hypothetical protein L249_8368 [Ophiocordyceps polyrhachis-furcata BCC 54312]|uniref:Uncharacterized protein n=1 Tax=Ophiocordyceps polyrhachis-furcata BCC 54312 TaxID=1330021 RepID=A0A367L1I0_9HYPO|nr:hypothetical protein L249_8368 [Ophiocordyceps polyrhachis-furcata BCC 54312]
MGYRAQGPLQFLPNKKGIHSHVGRDGPNEVICIPSQRAEPGLITSKGYTSKKKKTNHKVRKADADYSSKYFSRYFKVPTCSTLTYLYKIGDLEEDLYVPYPAVSAVLRGVWVRIRPYL